MLSERINALFTLLQCSNTEIARHAGCSPSNISRLKCGLSTPAAGSRSILRLADAVYSYADYENMLDVLARLCGAKDTQAKTLIPAIAGWLFEEQDYEMPDAAEPRSRRTREKQRHTFGGRLDKAMTLLDLSNGKLAAALNVDASLVSRYRSGDYYPGSNLQIREHLSEVLAARAEKTGRSGDFAKLCGVEENEISPELIMEWLFAAEEENTPDMALTILNSIDAFTPGHGLAFDPPALPPLKIEDQYWGTEGLRAAVIRFLSDAASEGGELMLYSDEPMDWMSGDRAYFAMWASLMVACVRRGVRIRIIHNVDRIGPEMNDAISGWFPLYMSGLIEPYLFRTVRNARFHHTIFLRPGSACILGFFPSKAEDNRWYDYITEKRNLDALEEEFTAMLSKSSPFLKTFNASQAEAFRSICEENAPDRWISILSGLSLLTIPEELLERMLARAEALAGKMLEILAVHRRHLEIYKEKLEKDGIHEILCLPEREEILAGGVRLNLSEELIDLPVFYTPDEYREHLAAVRELALKEKNYHLVVLPEPLFRDLQILTLRDAAAVIRSSSPCMAFAFMNAVLSRSVTDYCNSVMEKYAEDRFTTVKHLSELSDEISGRDADR